LFLAGIVAAAGSDDEAFIAAGAGIDVNGAISADALGSGGLVDDGVLIANIFGDGAADFVDFIYRLGQECDSASALGDGLKGSFGASLFLVTQNANGIDGGSVFFLNLTDCLLQRFAAGIVFAVGHHKENFPL